MALFFSAEAKDQPAPAAQIEIDKLRAELQRQKDASRLRARHGPQLKDEQVDEMLKEERVRAAALIKKKERAEKNRLNEITLDKAYRALACKLVKEGKILLSLMGDRITELTPDLIILCPHCGQPLNDLSDAVYQFAYTWHCTPDSYERVIRAFTIHSARSPLTEQGFAGYLLEPCPHCHERVMGVVQMVVI
jgi:hypothetical protein